MMSRKLWSSAVTVTILPAWTRPTWIFWVATMMPPREETRRCTVTGPDGGSGAGAAFRAPRSRYRPAVAVSTPSGPTVLLLSGSAFSGAGVGVLL
jgi:hypothetical protein